MKQWKARGPRGIPAEVITTLEGFGITEKTKLMNTIYENGEIPVDMKKSVLIALLKKPETTDVLNTQAISHKSSFTST